jgi:hypothetical protein
MIAVFPSTLNGTESVGAAILSLLAIQGKMRNTISMFYESKTNITL